MSRFSTINSQHSATRDLERQRLERKMGQLRREVEGCDQTNVKPGMRDERRFKPPRRRQLPSRCNSDAGQQYVHSTPPSARNENTPPSARSGKNEETLKPGPTADVVGGERAPSVEMAWLWSASNRMDEDAQQVAAFLTKHGLDRYATLIADEPSGLGASLDTLSQADDALLEKAGLPASPRGHLLTALQAELAATKALASAPSRPRSAASMPGCQTSAQRASTPGQRPQWGCLGKPPPGWSTVTPGLSALSSRVVQKADACTGGDSLVCVSEMQDASADTDEPTSLLSQVMPAQPEARQPTPLLQGRPTPVPQVSRPSSAASRPGTSSGTTERVSCYQCYKQILSKFATEMEDPLCEGVKRQFCGEACVQLFQRSMEERRERERQLNELRASLLEGSEIGTEDAS